MVGHRPGLGPTGAGARGPSRLTRWWRSASPGSGPARCPWTPVASPSAPACCGWTPGARPTPGGSSAARWPATPRGPPSPGSDDPAGPRPPRGPIPSDTCASCRPTSAGNSAEARWFLEPVDYLSMCFTGVAGGLPRFHGRRLADRQPAPRRAGLRPGAGGPFGRRPRTAAPAPPHGHGDRNRPPWRWRPISACRPACRWSRARRTSTRRRAGPVRCSSTRPTWP